VRRRTEADVADHERFERIYRSTRQSLLAYLLRRTESRDDAADLLSEIYLVAWRRLGDVPAGEEARLWLFGVARRTLSSHRRKARAAAELAAALKRTLAVTEVQTPLAEGGLAAGVVVKALGELSPGDRELLMLSGWEGLTPAQIAVVVGRPAALVRVRLHRARERLRAKLPGETKPLPIRVRATGTNTCDAQAESLRPDDEAPSALAPRLRPVGRAAPRPRRQVEEPSQPIRSA
jgi:RNA polymerase sigma factor (sigma-70 family)